RKGGWTMERSLFAFPVTRVLTAASIARAGRYSRRGMHRASMPARDEGTALMWSLRLLFLCTTVTATGCSLLFDVSGYRFEDEAGQDAQAPGRDAGAWPDEGRDDGGALDAGDSDAGAGPCGEPCGGSTPYCDPDARRCVECLVAGHCGWRCEEGTCVDPVDVAPGAAHTCVLLDDGTIECWGNNTVSELGDGTMASRLEPARVLGVSDATAIASFFTHTCAVLRSGELRCWGENGYGQLGEGDNAPRLAPVTVIDITNGFQVSTGLSHTCVRLATGDVACWGANAQG